MDIRGNSPVGAVASLLLRGELRVTLDDLPFTLQRLSPRRRAAILLAAAQKTLRPRRLIARPIILQIEPTNRCQLRCPVCATGAGLLARKPSTLSFESFAKVIDQTAHHACIVFFWSWGEPFLNPEACRMIRYATGRGLVVHTTTNGHLFTDPARALEVVNSGLSSLVFAVDGFDQATYAAYRRGGNLDAVVQSIRNIVRARRDSGADRPFLTLRFIVMKHNEHQAGDAEAFARELGMDAVTLRRPVLRRESVELEAELGTSLAEFQPPDSIEAVRACAPAAFCNRPLSTLTVFSDGQVVFCENDHNAEHPLGSIEKYPVADIIGGRAARRLFSDFQEVETQPPFCAVCECRGREGSSHNVRTTLFREAAV